MEVIKVIRDADVGESFPIPSDYTKRVTVRAVVFDSQGKIALLHSAKGGYHTIPGGGIETNESLEEALRREVKEEVGCSINDIRELGVIEEYRNEQGRHQISYGFMVNLDGDKGESNFDELEIAEGFVCAWITLEDAIETFQNDSNHTTHKGKFICLRDLTFLREAQRILKS